MTYAGEFLFWGKTYFNDPTSPPGAGGGTSSRPSDNADEAAPPVPGGLVGSLKYVLPQKRSPPAYVTVITEGSTKAAGAISRKENPR